MVRFWGRGAFLLFPGGFVALSLPSPSSYWIGLATRVACARWPPCFWCCGRAFASSAVFCG
eukprot:9694295-Lingulodinium_polyedra.AAC.1